MISLGFLTVYEYQEHDYVTEIAKRAHHYGISVYRFTPLSIDPLTEKVNGERFDDESQSWISCMFDIPSLLYDRCFYRSDDRSKKSKPIVQWLKNRPDVTFLGHGFPNKWELYQSVSNHPILSFYTPKTARLHSANDLTRMLRNEKAVICKPEQGSRGRGIYIVKKAGKQLHVIDAFGDTILHVNTRQTLNQWLDSLHSTSPYLIQPLFSFQTDEGNPFDLRFLLQKNEHDQWVERGRGVRIGNTGTFVANISAGATIYPFSEWVHHLSPHKRLLIADGIDTILRSLPPYLEQQFGPLFELGLDIGVTGDGAVWIIDMNSKPGRKIVTETAPHESETLYHSPLRYCQFLAKEVNIQ